MNCDELVEVVTDYLEDRLAPDMRLRFEAHIRECPGCDNYLDQIRLLTYLAPMTRERTLTGLAERLLPAFRDWRSAHQPG